MKTTIIHICAFATSFSIKVRRKHFFLSLADCIQYVKSNLEWDTAEVTYIKQDKKIIYNKDYKEPYTVRPSYSHRYLRQRA